MFLEQKKQSRIAQLVERDAYTVMVEGSSPSVTIICVLTAIFLPLSRMSLVRIQSISKDVVAQSGRAP